MGKRGIGGNGNKTALNKEVSTDPPSWNCGVHGPGQQCMGVAGAHRVSGAHRQLL